jgi:pyruvate kinase
MSRISSGMPIFALTPHQATRRKVCMYRGVYPSIVDFANFSDDEITKSILDQLKQFGRVNSGDLVIVTRGQTQGEMGGTNRMEIVKVP